MEWPPQGTGLFEYKTPCCVCPCFLTLPVDPTLGGTAEYADVDLAHDAIDDQVSNCWVYSDTPLSAFTAFSTALSAGTAQFNLSWEYPIECDAPPPLPPFPPPPPPPPCGQSWFQWFSVFSGAATIDVAYDVSATATTFGGADVVTVTVYDDTYSVIDTQTDATQGNTSGIFTLTLAGSQRYIISIEVHREAQRPVSPSPPLLWSVSAAFDFALPTGTELCGVTALYDDSGDTKHLPCCYFQCRTKGDGSALLCGFSEFTSPSSPPKKYRTCTFSGDMHTCQWHGADCISGAYQGQTRWLLFGACAYDIDTCGLISTGTAMLKGSDSSVACGDPLTGFSPSDYCDPSLSVPTGIIPDGESSTPTTHEKTGSGVCLFLGGVTYYETFGSVLASLSGEDTDADAVHRVDLGAWNNWGDVTGTGLYNNCTAVWEDRTSGFGFAYQPAQWRVMKAGLAPSIEYSVVIQIYRRTFGSMGAFSLYQTIIATETTDVDGNFEVTGDVPNALGFESVALCNCVIYQT